jgi:hypothetical protein
VKEEAVAEQVCERLCHALTEKFRARTCAKAKENTEEHLSHQWQSGGEVAS